MSLNDSTLMESKETMEKWIEWEKQQKEFGLLRNKKREATEKSVK